LSTRSRLSGGAGGLLVTVLMAPKEAGALRLAPNLRVSTMPVSGNFCLLSRLTRS
jgi:hypothetical protein